MADLERAVAAKDWKATSECAHKIKPTFYYVGREDAKEHMQTMERNAREQINLENIPADFAEAKTFVDQLYQQLQAAKADLENN
ncbi:hypothetical protein D9M68_793740 [compost metagenome]